MHSSLPSFSPSFDPLSFSMAGSEAANGFDERYRKTRSVTDLASIGRLQGISRLSTSHTNEIDVRLIEQGGLCDDYLFSTFSRPSQNLDFRLFDTKVSSIRR